jgi:hypothetical protein
MIRAVCIFMVVVNRIRCLEEQLWEWGLVAKFVRHGHKSHDVPNLLRLLPTTPKPGKVISGDINIICVIYCSATRLAPIRRRREGRKPALVPLAQAL